MSSIPSSPYRRPSSELIEAAEQLELDHIVDDDHPHAVTDTNTDNEDSHSSITGVSHGSGIDRTPTRSLLTPRHTPRGPTAAGASSSSSVRAAAARWGERNTSPTPSPRINTAHDLISPSSSTFRSVVPSSGIMNPSPIKLGSTRSSDSSKSTSPTKPSTPSTAKPDDVFADVDLSASSSPSKPPPPPSSNLGVPEPVITPPAVEHSPVTTTKSFFSSSKFPTASSVLGFGVPRGSPVPPPSTNSASSSVAVAETASLTSPMTAPVPTPSPSGWRSTMSNFLTARSVSSAQSSTGTTPPPPSQSQSLSNPPHPPPPHPTRTPSTSFLLNRIESEKASNDRRISRELGDGDRLREGFERVRNEMEGAAREIRRERAKGIGGESDSDVLEGEVEGQLDADGVDWVFWGAVVQDYEQVARTRPKDLSRAIQQGVPPVIRGAIWQLMSSSKSVQLEESYKALLKLNSPHEKAIAKDLSRTFPNHKYFQQGGGVGQESLFMVVKAYSLYDQEVGYTQGLAFIVAALLLNMPDEEAFCVLVRLMDSYNLRSHFLADMPGLQLRLFQFDHLVEEILPLLHTHFVRKGIKSSMYASQWFMTLFSYRFPLSLVYRVLDIVFAEGIEAIFRFSLALLRKSEDELLELEFEQILRFLQADIFEVYRVSPSEETEGGGETTNPQNQGEEEWLTNDFVRDAYAVRITPFMLDQYQSEWEEKCREQNAHAAELDQLRNANRHLSSQVKSLEASLLTINQEHVELVRQLVMAKIEKEETENELVRYKMLYAQLAHASEDAMSIHSRSSQLSLARRGSGE